MSSTKAILWRCQQRDISADVLFQCHAASNLVRLPPNARVRWFKIACIDVHECNCCSSLRRAPGAWNAAAAAWCCFRTRVRIRVAQRSLAHSCDRSGAARRTKASDTPVSAVSVAARWRRSLHMLPRTPQRDHNTRAAPLKQRGSLSRPSPACEARIAPARARCSARSLPAERAQASSRARAGSSDGTCHLERCPASLACGTLGWLHRDPPQRALR